MKGKIINLQLDDSFYKEEIRDGYTVTTKQKKIWAVEMDLLDQLLKVCKKHDIKVIIYKVPPHKKYLNSARRMILSTFCVVVLY